MAWRLSPATMRRAACNTSSGPSVRAQVDLDAGTVEMRTLGEQPAEASRPLLPMEQPEDMAGQLIEARPAGKLALRVSREAVEHLEA